MLQPTPRRLDTFFAYIAVGWTSDDTKDMMLALDQGVDQSMFTADRITADASDWHAFADAVVEHDRHAAISKGRELFGVQARCNNCTVNAVAPDLIEHLVNVRFCRQRKQQNANALR